MPASFDGKLVVAISSRALFDLEESNRVFEEQGVNAYYRYQLEHENEVLAPGIAFALVRKLLRLNALAPAQPRVEVILLSRNTADTGMRIMNSIEHYELDISLDHFIRLPDVALGHAGQFVSIDCIRHSRVSEESAFDRGCVKTQFYFEFGGLPTNTQPEIIEYSAFWKADVLRAGSVLRFYTASTIEMRPIAVCLG